MKTSGKKRSKLTGKGADHTFLRLTHQVLNSEQWASLSGNAIKLLLELARHYRGSNNGDLSMALSTMKPRGWRSSDMLHKAKSELLTGGWIVCTRQGGKNCCSLYAITWERVDECDRKHDWPVERVASHRWQQREPYSAQRSNARATAPSCGPIANGEENDRSALRTSQADPAR